VSPRLSDLLLSSQSDERLVSLARAGQERAFAVIVERYRAELHALARRLCPDGLSEDVVQQAFLSAFTALRSGCEVRHLRGWLYQIVRNTAGHPDAPLCVPLDGTTASASILEEVVQQRALARTALSEIARLPARQRQAMIGTALDGRARAEIATSMGLSEGAVRQLVHRARTTLRGAVTALTPWPLARWISAVGPDAPGPAELAVGAGAASSGGLVLKLGALLASGTFLTGAAVHLDAPARHRPDARAAISVHPRPAVARAHQQVVASVAPSLAVREVLTGSHPAGAASGGRRAMANVGAPVDSVRHGRHNGTSTGSGKQFDGSPGDGHGSGRGRPPDPTGSSRGGGSDGSGAFSPPRSGSGSGVHGDGQDDGPGGGGGTRTDGRDGPGDGTRSDGGGGAQMVSDSHSLDSAVDGSGSWHGSDSRDGSTSDAESASSTGSVSAVGSGSGKDSGSGNGSGSDGGASADGGSGSGSGAESGSGDSGGTSGG
jgi:RNA polymerase sigma factor (sigma-70 family)